MKTKQTFLGAALVALGVATLALNPFAAQAQVPTSFGPVNVSSVRPIGVSDIKTAVSTDVGIYVRYVGTGTGVATVAVDAATGDLALVANGAADATVTTNCAGGVADSIDVSDTDCDTIGEVVDHINSSADWIAVPHAALRADSSNNTLITLAATDAKGVNGLGLLVDSAVALKMGVVLAPNSYDQDGNFIGINAYANLSASPRAAGAGQRLIRNPFSGATTQVHYVHENITTTDNAANLVKVFCVVPKFVDNGNSTEVAREIYREAGALTTVTGKIDEFLNSGGLQCDDGKIVVVVNGTTTLTAPVIFATGRFWVR